MNFLRLLRNKSVFNNSIVNHTLRGPKKKSGGKKEIVESKHLLNLYKDKDDTNILSDEFYPKWLFQTFEPSVLPHDLLYIYLRGEKIVPASDQFTISRNLRRRITKFRNETKDYNKPILKSYDEDKEEFAWEIDGDNPDLSPLIQELNEEIRVRNGNVDHDEGPSEEKKEDKKEKKE